MPLKLEKRENRLFLQNHIAFTLSNLVKCYGFMKTTIFWTLPFSAFTKSTDTFNKNKRCYMTLEGMSNVCAKLDLANSKSNKILAINVFRSLYRMLPVKFFNTGKVFLAISPLEESIVAKIWETFLCKTHTHTHKTFPIGKSICESSLTGELL